MQPRYRALLGLLASFVLITPAAAQRPLKVLISVDMEGITGVVSSEQLAPSGFEYDRAREWMTGDALAAVQAAKEAGATEIVVADSHGNGQNLLINRFPADVTIIRSWPRPLMMVQGVDSTTAAVIFIGYHASTSNVEGVRAHTMSSASYAEVALNGMPVPESVFNAAIAGHFGVPVIMISGDNAAVGELQKAIGDVEGAIVKRAISFHSAATMTPEAGQALIRQKVKAAMGRLGSFKPYILKGPVRVDLTFKNYRPAEMMAYLPNVQRTSSHAIRFVAKDMVEASRFLEFVGTYEAGLTP